MNATLRSTLIGILMLAGGATAVVIADRRGWIADSPTTNAANLCPHGIEAARCPFCDPSLVEKLGQCVEHGVPEALCTLCRPWLIAAFKNVGDWCAEHDLPDSQCVIHHPELAAAQPSTISTPPRPAILEALNAAPPIRRILAPPSVTCETSKLQIRFASPEIAGAVGLEYARVERREIAKTIKRNAEIRFDENRLAHLASRAPGVVVSVEKDLGDRVSAGETLAVVDSAELGSTKADYLRAAAFVNLWEKNSAREGRLLAGGVGTERDALEAETSLIESRVALAGAAQRLRNLGISDERIERLAETGEADSRLELTAPFDGVVIERSATAGEVVDAARPLFTVGDPSRVWAIVDVYEDDAPQLSAGRPVIFANAGLAGDARGGFITWVSPRVDPRTRTIKVRAEIDNPDGRLRAGMFGEAEIVVHDREAKSLAPKEAVQWEGCCNVVFVRRSDTLFEPRKVWIGYETDRHVAIESGLDGDEEIVTTGSFLLKTELLKGSIGAGCCEVAPGK